MATMTAMTRRTFLHAGAMAAGAASAGAAAPNERPHFPIIDAHCHAGRGFRFGDPEGAPWETFNDPADVLRLAAEAGIARTVIFPINHQTYAEANRGIAGYVAAHPDRLIGFAKHDAQHEAGRITELLRHEVGELGLRGLKCHDQPSDEMCEAAMALGIPILMHPWTVAEGVAMVEKYPAQTFILAHLGSFSSRDYREHERAIEATAALPNLYLETSSVVFQPYLEKAAELLPSEKLIFGSDGPLIDPRVELMKIRLLRLGAQAEQRVLGGNIGRLLGSSVD